MEKVSERLKLVVDCWVDQRTRFKQLEAMSGIPSAHWKNFWHGRQRAHEEFIQFVARKWPQYAFWLVTGIEDEKFGHVRPTPADKALPPTATAAALAKKIEINEKYYSLTARAAWDYKTDDEQNREIEEVLDNLDRTMTDDPGPEFAKLAEESDLLNTESKHLDELREKELCGVVNGAEKG